MKPCKSKFAEDLNILTNRYLKHRDQYENQNYNETDVRNEFLNKLFKLLGWDIENENGLSPSDREVWMERGDCQGKRPDYNFRLNGKTSFYLEAKAPHVNTDSQESVYQAKSYSWSTTESLVSISVLSNFKEIIVFDTTMVPDFDYPDRGQIFKYSVEQFTDKKAIDNLWLLSKEEMLKGTLVNSLTRDKSRDVFRVRPDKRLLELLNHLRLQLASGIYKENNNIKLETIQDIVGTLINRLLFIRVLEDRGTIDKRGLKDIVDDWEEHQGKKGALLIKAIREEFAYINENFNGKLFHGDPLAEVSIDANILAGVIKSLYGRKCPFAFNRLDTNTLGHIYEKFLSCEIVKKGKGVSLVEKEVIRKSGGVFYTPKEIVEFMCKDALAKTIASGKPLDEIRVLDPSCGSGTFLLTSYRILLEESAKRQNIERSELTFTEKRKLLLSSIFGIDVDGEAGKVAVLSLCLMALENESHISKGKRLLPNLHENLLKADSLIEKPIEGRMPVDTKRFPTKGKSLVILGNPPYLSVRRDFFSDAYKKCLEKKYITAEGHWDTYALFLERCQEWNPDVCSLIVPKPILTNENQLNVRRLISKKLSLVTDVGAVFEDAAVEAVVLQSEVKSSKIVKTLKWKNEVIEKLGEIDRNSINSGEIINLYSDVTLEKSFSVLNSSALKLENFLLEEIHRGIEKGKNALCDKPGKGKIKCFSGGEVDSLLTVEPKKYIEVDWSERATFKFKALFKGPKVLVRRVTNDLVASVDYSDSSCLNTLYVLKPNSNFEVETLACYLNSTPIKFWFKYKYVNDDALFPYVRKNQIEDIPMPAEIEVLESRIRSFSNEMVHSAKLDHKLLSKIDLEVCKSFGLSDKDLIKMKKFLERAFAQAA